MNHITGLLTELYGLEDSEVHLLEGYQDRTFLVESRGTKNVLKLFQNTAALEGRMTLETKYIKALDKSLPYDFPVPLGSLKGKTLEREGDQRLRLLPFLEGKFLAEIPHTNALLKSLGTFLGKVNQVGKTVHGEDAIVDSFWDLQHLSLHKAHADAIEHVRDRALVKHFLLQFTQVVEPQRYTLRKCLIHNDANDWNVLTDNGEVSGIIDFGDMCYSWLINELAVALPYVLSGKEDPLGVASLVIEAYHKECPLLPEEINMLYYLIAGRICMSLCNSAIAKKGRPESDYIRISEAQMRELLHQWIAISPEMASDRFLEAAGLAGRKLRSCEDYLNQRSSLLPRSLSLSYSTPIVMQRAAFQYMFDARGDRFLDAYNNIMLVGHCHPAVVQGTTKVLQRLNTNTRYLYDEILKYSEHLLGYFPPELSRVFLVNSGSAATDLALRLSRAFTGREKVMALEAGYHGNTLAGISVSHYKHSKGVSYPNTLLCPMPKVYGSGMLDDGSAGVHYAHFCKKLLEQHSNNVGAFIAEPIMGCGGQVPLPKGFLSQVYKMVRAQGGLCISDEVQVGFGRLGNWNWGFEKYEVVPDIVVLGKPMGNGHPIGAVVTTCEIASVFDSGPEFFSSFGGNPVSCAAGDAVLGVLETEGLKEHALETGTYLKEAFRDLSSKHRALADIRGDGLFLGVELLDADEKPNTVLAQTLKNRLREAYILIGTDGPHDNVLKIKPPLPFNRENCDELIYQTSKILTNVGDS